MARFTQISMGSASELQNHLRLAHDLGYLNPVDYASTSRDLTSVRQMLTAFLQSIRGQRNVRSAVLAKSE
jgi:four helix bundle protein